jgi:hypothetical protein
MGGLLLLKDSIRTAKLQLDVLRDEYVRCMNKNRDMTRRLWGFTTLDMRHKTYKSRTSHCSAY